MHNLDVAKRLAETLERSEAIVPDPNPVPVPEWLIHAAVAEIRLLEALIRDSHEYPELLPSIVDLLPPQP